MADNELFPVPDSVAERAYVDEAGYREMYRRSIEDPEGFWGEHGKRIHWIKPYKAVRDVSYAPDDVHIRARRRPYPLVLRRHAERLGQLPGPASVVARRAGGDRLGRRRSRPVQAHHL